MIKLFVDSGSGIKKEERETYRAEILPLKISLNGIEYFDGEDLPRELFYSALTNEKIFPKTSLPSLLSAEERVNACVAEGYDVLVLTMSAGISGTHDTLKALFRGNERVRVVDSETSVGGLKILAKEASKYLDFPLDFAVQKIEALRPRIKILGVPETLTYLHRGGRLNAVTRAVGSALHIKPIIELKRTVKIAAKTFGLRQAMKTVAAALKNCDENYPIVPSYTYDPTNLNALIAVTEEKYKPLMTEYDEISPVIAAHWGPNAFGYVFVEKA